MEQNKELRFLVDTMLKTYDQLNKQIAEELSAGTPIPAKEIMGETSEELLEYFDKESDYDEVNGQFVYLFEKRGFAQKYEDSRYRYDDIYKDFLDSFSDYELIELVDRICEFSTRSLRTSIGNRLNNKIEKLNCKESA